MTTELATGVEVPEEKLPELRQLVEKINGFVYMGDGTEAIIKTVRILRANPDFATRLLDLPERGD